MTPLSTEASDARTLVEALRHQAGHRPDQVALTFLHDAGEDVDVDYAALDRTARAVAVRLAEHCRPGDRVLLILPVGPQFVSAFFGCLYAGMIPVPLAARAGRGTTAVLGGILRDAGAAAVVTCREGLSEQFEELLREAGCAAVEVEGIGEPPAGWTPEPAAGSDLAFLQYTSGTTSTPKGVMVSHENLLHNLRLIRDAFAFGEDSVMAGWLPHHHDMGLIGTILVPLYLGVPTVLMTPASFVRRPAGWLDAISRYRATISGGPNFAYDACVRRITEAERERLDLSSWRVAFNGAEPVRAETLRRFARTFRPAGFRPESLLPCYGLAEGTLLAAGRAAATGPVIAAFDADRLREDEGVPPDSALAERTELVGCQILPGVDVRIADPDGNLLGDGRIGEVWLAGGSVAGGYWRRPDATAGTFAAAPRTASGATYLRTGDLAFTSGGSLFVRGRIKDCVVIRGRNHHPEDIEATIREACPEIADRVAVFGTGPGQSDEEALVAWYELRSVADEETVRQLAARARAQVARTHGVELLEICGVAPGTVQVTTSGKIRRGECARARRAGEVRVVAPDPLSHPAAASSADETGTAPLGELVGLAAGLVQRVPGAVDPGACLAELGFDSLKATEFQHLVEERFGLRVGLVELLGELTLRQLADRVAGSAATGLADPDGPPPPPDDPTGPFPLSPGQRSIWLQERLAETSGNVNLSRAVELRGDLDVARLRAALDRVVVCHPALRTRFVEANGLPAQQIAEWAEVDLAVHDAERWSDPELQAALGRAAGEAFGEPPLLRAALYTLGERRAVLQLTTHHAVMDVWSLAVLVGSLVTAYRDPAALAPSPVGPRDWVAWQERHLTGEQALAAATEQARRLSGVPRLEIPADRPRPPVRRFLGATHDVRLDAALTERITDFAARTRTGVPAVLFAAYGAVLSRLSAQLAFTLGFVHSGRVRSRFAGLVGYHATAAPIVIDLEGQPDAFALTRSVHEQVLAASDREDLHAAVPQPGTEPGDTPGTRAPLSAVFAFQQGRGTEALGLAPLLMNHAGQLADWAHLRAAAVPVPQGAGYFELSLFAAEHRGELLLTFDYDRELLRPQTVAALSAALAAVLSAICDKPQAPVSTLPLTLPGEDATGTSGARTEQDELCVHHLVARTAHRTPDAPALIAEDATLTYAQLDTAANRIAHRLIGMGVRPEDHVAILLPRSAHSLAAVLGVLKSGAAYVPLDPAYPVERLRYMVADSAATVLVAHASDADALPGLALVDPADPALAGEPGHDPGVAVHPDNVAYVVYTSGSTGTPHGVLGLHRGITNRQHAVLARFPFEPGEVGSHKTSLSFFDSGGEMFLPLCAGAPVVVVPERTGRDPVELVRLLERHRVSRLVAVPSLLRAMLDSDERLGERLSALRYCHSSGEALTTDIAERWRRTLPGCTLVDLYGSSELSADATLDVVTDAERVGIIGRAIDNLRVRVLDAGMNPVPDGFPGELHVAGAGLARGYLGRPGLTADRFRPDPFGPPGARLFRTGDRGRVEPDGALRYLGRLDAQVKIRGFRIELGEVEAALRDHPGVRAAAAVVVGDTPQNRHVVAAVVPDPAHRPAAPDAAAHDGERTRLANWRALYDRMYSEAGDDEERQARIWTSSFTGKPFTAAEVGEWTDQAVGRIRDWRPRRLLEIGCGTGNVALPLAEDCERYVGTDISPVGLDMVRRRLKEAGLPPGAVHTLRRDARDFTGLDPRSFDTVVLNSVVQYFPGHAYLLDVLRGAVEATADGGRIYLGDVRSLDLAPAFHTAVELTQARHDPVSAGQLRLRVARRAVEEEELLCSRGFFENLPLLLPRLTAVEIHLKRGRADNELNAYRHDIVLKVGAPARPDSGPRCVHWERDGLDLGRLRALLREARTSAVQVCDVPNARLAAPAADLARMAALRNDQPAGPAGEIDATAGVDPQDLWSLARAMGRELDVVAAASRSPYAMDLWFRPAGEERTAPTAEVDWRRAAPSPDDRTPLSNDPLWGLARRALLTELRRHVRGRLPEFMVPTIEVVDRLPTTDTGKVDRRAIAVGWKSMSTADRPAPTDHGSGLSGVIAAAWHEALGIESVGQDDNFFDVGGNSLSLVQVHLALQKQAGREFPLVEMYEHTTIRRLTAFLSATPGIPAARQPAGVDDDFRGEQAAQRRQLKRQRMKGV